MANVLVQVVKANANTVSGNQSITISGFGTPKAARIVMMRADVEDAADSDKSVSIGITDGTRSRCVGVSDNNGVTTSEVQSVARNNCVVALLDPNSSGLEAVATFTAWVTDGIQINWSTAPSDDWLLIVTLYRGDTLTAYVNDFTVSSASTVDVTDPGFEPDMVVGISSHSAFGTGSGSATTAQMCYGVCANDGGADPQDQRCSSRLDLDAVSTSAPQHVMDSTHIFRELEDADPTSILTGIKLESFDSSGFSAAVDNWSSNTCYIGYLALGFGGGIVGWSVQDFAPSTSSTGNQADTTAGYTPQFLDIITSQTVNYDNANPGALSTIFGIGSTDGTREEYFGCWSKDNVTNMTTGQRSINDLAEVRNHQGSAVWGCTFVSFDTNGFTVNIYDTAPNTRANIVALIGEDTSGSALVEVVNDTVGITETIVDVLVTSLVEVVDETVGISESVEQHRAIVEVVDETEGISEGTIAARTMVRVVDETEGISEGTIAARAMVRVVDETEGVTESVEQHRAIVQVVDETEGVTETVVDVIASSLVKVVDETVGISESIEQHRAIVEVVDETVTVVENPDPGPVRVLSLVRVVDETEAISEGTVAARTLVRIVDETEEIGEAVEQHRAIVQVVDETEGVTETVVDVLAVGGSALVEVVDETVGISESVEQHRAIVEVVDETEAISEVLAQARSLVRVIDETEAIAEVLAQARSLVRVIDETEAISEVLAQARSLVRVIDETESITEAVESYRGLVEVVNEAVAVSETALGVLGDPGNPVLHDPDDLAVAGTSYADLAVAATTPDDLAANSDTLEDLEVE